MFRFQIDRRKLQLLSRRFNHELKTFFLNLKHGRYGLPLFVAVLITLSSLLQIFGSSSGLRSGITNSYNSVYQRHSSSLVYYHPTEKPHYPPCPSIQEINENSVQVKWEPPENYNGRKGDPENYTYQLFMIDNNPQVEDNVKLVFFLNYLMSGLFRQRKKCSTQ